MTSQKNSSRPFFSGAFIGWYRGLFGYLGRPGYVRGGFKVAKVEGDMETAKVHGGYRFPMVAGGIEFPRIVGGTVVAQVAGDVEMLSGTILS